MADGTVFVGNVSMVGRSSGAFAESRVGSAVPELADPDVRGGDVLAIVDDGAGGWVIAGEFTTVGGQPCRGLAHLTADDRLDRRLCVGVDQGVTALARRGSTVYLAGPFTRVGGKPRSSLAALDVKSGRLLPWTTTVTGRPVYDEHGGQLDLVPRSVNALAVLGDTVYIGGFFEDVGGELRKNLAALDASSGRVLTWRADVGEPLASGVSFEDVALLEAVPGRLYVSGNFSRISDEPRESIGAVDPATGRLLDWRVQPASLLGGGGASDIAVHEGAVYFRSWLDDSAGRPRDSLAVVDAGTGRGHSYHPFASSVTDVHALNALVVDGHRLVVGGSFDGLGGHPDASFLTIDLRSGKVLGWGPATDGWVTALAVRGGTVALGGGFHMIPIAVRDGLAAFDARTGKLLPLRSRLAFDEPGFERVKALAVDGSTLYLAGRFTAVDGQPRTGLAAIDIRTGKLTDWAPRVTGSDFGGQVVLEIQVLAVAGDAIYIGGLFEAVNGEPRYEGLAAIDASSGEILDWDPALEGSWDVLTSIAAVGGVVYVVGLDFNEGIGAFDARSGDWLEWTPAIEAIGELYEDPEVRAVVGHEGRVYLGGNFRSVDGFQRSGVVSLDGRTQDLLPFRARVPQTPERTWNAFSDVLAVTDDLLAVTSPVSGRPMLFDPISGQRLSWRPHGDSSLDECSSMAIDSSALAAMCGGRLLFFPRKTG